MAERAQIDWQRLKKSLDTVTCIRRDHPLCEWHYTEAQAFKRISKLIRESKEVLEELQWMRSVAKPSASDCELHWIRDCSECSAIGRVDRAIKRAKARLGKLRFALISLPTVAEAMGRSASITAIPSELQAEVGSPSAESGNSVPTVHLYGRERTGNETARLSRKDIADNIRLIEAWLRSRAA